MFGNVMDGEEENWVLPKSHDDLGDGDYIICPALSHWASPISFFPIP